MKLVATFHLATLIRRSIELHLEKQAQATVLIVFRPRLYAIAMIGIYGVKATVIPARGLVYYKNKLKRCFFYSNPQPSYVELVISKVL